MNAGLSFALQGLRHTTARVRQNIAGNTCVLRRSALRRAPLVLIAFISGNAYARGTRSCSRDHGRGRLGAAGAQPSEIRWASSVKWACIIRFIRDEQAFRLDIANKVATCVRHKCDRRKRKG